MKNICYFCRRITNITKTTNIKKTMKQFNDKNFVLDNEVAQDLFHNHAAKELWLGGDHYKWRAMRTNGIEEKYITGKDTTDWEKFEKWAETVPYTLRNPLYHWTHLELKTAFGIDKLLSPKTAREIFDECNEKLQKPEFSARGLMKHYNVECVCTTDDPVDDLHNHIEYAKHKAADDPMMFPAWRPDKAVSSATMVLRSFMTKSIPIRRLRPSSRRLCVASRCRSWKSASTRTAS